MKAYFEAKAKGLAMSDNGLIKPATEHLLVDAMTFTECEAKVLKHYEGNDSIKELAMFAASRSKIEECVMYGDTDQFWKVRVDYEAGEEGEKPKNVAMYLLVNANDDHEAGERTREHLKEWLVPYEISSVIKSKIGEVV